MRHEEGYDITGDALYTTRAKLKRATQPLADITNKMSQSSNPVPSHADTSTCSLPSCNSGRLLEDVPKIPERQQAKKTTRGMAQLPTHLSGEEMVQFLEERKAAREAKWEEKQQKAAKKASAKHKKQTTSISEQKAAHMSERTVRPVCDGECEEEGDNSQMWVVCIGCEEWFLHCTRISPRQHARLEQVEFVTSVTPKTLLYHGRHLYTLYVWYSCCFASFCTASLHFLYTSGNSRLWPEIPCALRLQICLCSTSFEGKYSCLHQNSICGFALA